MVSSREIQNKETSFRSTQGSLVLTLVFGMMSLNRNSSITETHTTIQNFTND
jgi:hypothetical protein